MEWAAEYAAFGARQQVQAVTSMSRFSPSVPKIAKLLGLKFRRQHLLHGFVVDFYCSELKLVVELESGEHGGPTQGEYDAARTAWLRHAVT